MKERWQILLILWCLELSMAKAQMVSMISSYFQLDPSCLWRQADFECFCVPYRWNYVQFLNGLL